MKDNAMKVKDLLLKLNGLSPELEVIGFCEDAGSLLLYEIDDIEAVQAEKKRLPDGTPGLAFGKSETSTMHVLLTLSSDF